MAVYNDSTKSSTWSDPTAWTLGHAPVEGENARILAGHTIQIDQNITVGDDSAAYAINIAATATLWWPSTVVGDYTLILKGQLYISGTFRIGDSSSVGIPASRTAIVKTNYSATPAVGEFGITIAAGGKMYVYGSDTTNGATGIHHTLLNQNITALDDHFHTADITGWKAGDTVVVAVTDNSGTLSRSEVKVLSVDSVGDLSTITTTFAYGHAGGTTYSWYVAEVIRINRNVIITSYNTAYPGYITGPSGAADILEAYWASFQYMAIDSTKCCPYWTGGTLRLQHCSYYVIGAVTTGAQSAEAVKCNGNVVACAIDYNDMYGGAYAAGMLNFAVTNFLSSLSTFSITNNWLIYNKSNAVAVNFQNTIFGPTQKFNGTFQYNRAAGVTYGYVLPPDGCVSTGVYSDNVAHDTSQGFYCTGHYGANRWSFDNLLSWNARAACMDLSGVNRAKFTNLRLYGYNTANHGLRIRLSTYNLFKNARFSPTTGGVGYDMTYATNPVWGNVFDSCVFDEYAAPQNSYSIYINTYIAADLFINCSGLYGPCGTGNAEENRFVTELRFQGCTLNTGVAITGVYNHRATVTTATFGGILKDSVVFRTAAPSERLTLVRTDGYWVTQRLVSSPKFAAVLSGETTTFSVYVMRSATYNGGAPRLVLKADASLGVPVDVVLETAHGSLGVWELLTGTTPAATANGEFCAVVDCGTAGTLGYINVDDWSVA